MWLSSSFLQCFPPMEEKTYFLSFQFFSDNPVWQMFSHGQIFSCNVFPPWMENIFSFYSCRALSQSYVAKYTKKHALHRHYLAYEYTAFFGVADLDHMSFIAPKK